MSNTHDLTAKGGHPSVHAHPGFNRAAHSIAAKQGISQAKADAVLAASTRKASASAKKANPLLRKVKGK